MNREPFDRSPGRFHWRTATASNASAIRFASATTRGATVAGSWRSVGEETDSFAGSAAERFRTGRHEAEYFDPDRPAEKTEVDARWAIEKAAGAIAAVSSALS